MILMITSNDTYIEPEIADLIDFLNSSNTHDVKILKKERVKEKLPLYTKALNTFLVYPDIFSDIMTPRNSSFSMFFAHSAILSIICHLYVDHLSMIC